MTFQFSHKSNCQRSLQSLGEFAAVEHTSDHLMVYLQKPHQVLSSGVLNGGLQWVDGVLNLRVPKHTEQHEPAETTLAHYGEILGVTGNLVGMMTAASMGSYHLAKRVADGVEIFVLATAGFSNARRAGDKAEYRRMVSEPEEIGTINIILLTNACLTQAALVEAVMMVTEAKAAALQNAKVLSPVSGLIATGTGTDSVVFVNGFGPEVKFCGKHVLFGELMAQAVIEAVFGAISWERATYGGQL
ncbi:adenosylcobinamide amidohydrolase [Oceanospirillum sp.]|uniref:adenosylcobinamide amidohydrolase n=1 Tax=Oceanospirillum sp. TaxID=2021254 RepID=UPI003A91F336